MFHSLFCKNFYSFQKKSMLSFVVNDKAPDNFGYFLSPAGVRLSKLETVIGPNASGKTNLLKVVPFIRWLIVSSFNKSPDHPIPVKPFIFTGENDLPTELGTTFEINKHIYQYEFAVNSKRILAEKLTIINKTKMRKTSKVLFLRTWDNVNNVYKLKFSPTFGKPAGTNNLIRDNASVVSTLFHLNHSMSQEIVKYWRNIETNVIEKGHSDDPDELALVRYSDNPILKQQMETILSRYDLGFTSVNIVKEVTEKGINIDAKLVHNIGSSQVNLEFEYESSGTKRLLVLLHNLLNALQLGSLAVIDEIDIKLHPDMVIELVNLFLQPESNPNNAQLLTSTHSHLVLSKLDKYQIVLTEKSKNGVTDTWRLDEVKGIRPDDNYYTKYMAGAYGAIPHIDV